MYNKYLKPSSIGKCNKMELFCSTSPCMKVGQFHIQLRSFQGKAIENSNKDIRKRNKHVTGCGKNAVHLKIIGTKIHIEKEILRERRKMEP